MINTMNTSDSSHIECAFFHIQIVDDDIHRIDGVNRNSRKFEMLLHSLARNESTLASNNPLMRDMLEETNETINPNTFADYLEVL